MPAAAVRGRLPRDNGSQANPCGASPPPPQTGCRTPAASDVPASVTLNGRYAREVAAAKGRVAKTATKAPPRRPYTATGDYLGYADTQQYERDPSLQLDADGEPLVSYDGVFYYNPVTTAEFALTQHGRYLQGDNTTTPSSGPPTFLITLQDSRGALTFPFPYTYYLTGEVLQPGWTSGMAQGEALSVFSRAYALSQDERYLAAGRAALEFLLTPHASGGPLDDMGSVDPGLAGYATFDEYPSKVQYFTLNGFMITVLGLYDWSGSELRQRVRQTPRTTTSAALRRFPRRYRSTTSAAFPPTISAICWRAQNRICRRTIT